MQFSVASSSSSVVHQAQASSISMSISTRAIAGVKRIITAHLSARVLLIIDDRKSPLTQRRRPSKLFVRPVALFRTVISVVI
jgi:hypothetical protein